MKSIAGLSLALVAMACNAEELASPGNGNDKARPFPAPDVTSLAATISVTLDEAGAVGAYTSLALAEGRLHLTYYDASTNHLKYATCARLCTSSGSWAKGVIDHGFGSSLKIASNGRRYVTYFDNTDQDLWFATCAPTAACTTAAEWSRAFIDGAGFTGFGSSLALGAGGSKEVTYVKVVGSAAEIWYATCGSNCAVTASWSRGMVDRLATHDFSHVGERTSLAIGPDGRRHVAYWNPVLSDLKYATCASACTNPGNWQKLAIDPGGAVGLYPSLAVGPDGVLHVSYWDIVNHDLKYARCAFDCTTATSWKKLAVWWVSNVGSHTSLAVEGNGRVHIIAYHETGTALLYATCNANCTAPSTWSKSTLDGATSQVGMYGSLAVRNGVLHVGYYDVAKADLKYLQRTP